MKLKIALAAASAVALTAGAAAAKTVAVTADRMVDVVAGRVVDRPIVIVTDGRITAVGTQGQLQVPAGAERVDLPGQTLLPGLIDMHVHIDSSPKYGGYTGLQFTDRFWSMLSVPHAQARRWTPASPPSATSAPTRSTTSA